MPSKTLAAVSRPEVDPVLEVAVLKQARNRYQLSKTSNIGIADFFTDYHEYNLKENRSWSALGRDVGRSRNVANHMMTHTTEEQRLFLLTRPPSTDKVGTDWIVWHNRLKDISRAVAEVTMRSLLEDEIKHLGAKTAKSNAGAKLTATISAVDGRLTKLKL